MSTFLASKIIQSWRYEILLKLMRCLRSTSKIIMLTNILMTANCQKHFVFTCVICHNIYVFHICYTWHSCVKNLPKLYLLPMHVSYGYLVSMKINILRWESVSYLNLLDIFILTWIMYSTCVIYVTCIQVLHVSILITHVP